LEMDVISATNRNNMVFFIDDFFLVSKYNN